VHASLERSDEAEELGVRGGGALVWRLCGGVRERAAWRVTSAVPGVVRKADIQIQPAPRGSYLVVWRECQLTSPRRVKSTQSRYKGGKSTQSAVTSHESARPASRHIFLDCVLRVYGKPLY